MVKPKAKRYLTEGGYVEEWFRRALRFTDGPTAGQRFVMYDAQREFMHEAFLLDPDTNRRVYQVTVESLPKKNGKTQKGAGLALYGIAADAPGGTLERNPRVPIAAAARHQAAELGDTAIAMCKASPSLMRRLKPRTHDIHARREGGGRLWWMSSDVSTAHGIKPSFSVVDELGSHKDEKLWTVIRGSDLSRDQPFHNVISHVGYDQEGPLADIYDWMVKHPLLEVHGGKGRNGRLRKGPALMVVRDRAAGQLVYWYGIGDRDDLDPEDPRVWEACNPAPWLTKEKLGGTRGTAGLRFENFCRWHLNMWVVITGAFLPTGSWASLADEEMAMPNGAQVFAGLDGAKKHDYGALGLCWPEWPPGADYDTPPRFNVACELFRADDSHTSIVARIKHATRRADRRYRLMEAHYDPHFLTESTDELEANGLNMLEFPQTPGRMSVATARFYELTQNKLIRHDNNPELARHVRNAVTVETGENMWRVTKGKSRGHIDGLVSIMLAVDAAYNAWKRGDIGPSSGVKIIR